MPRLRLKRAETLQLAPPQLSILTANLILGRSVDYEHDSRTEDHFCMLTAPQEAHFLLPAVMLAPHFGHPLWDILTSSSMVGVDGKLLYRWLSSEGMYGGILSIPWNSL